LEYSWKQYFSIKIFVPNNRDPAVKDEKIKKEIV
jgi:hypothetical protein